VTQPASTRRAPGRRSPAPALLPLAVVAAHRTGQPLNPQLVALGGRYLRVTVTAPVYRLLALAGGDVPRGGLWWAGAVGASVEVELHELPLAAVGALLSLLPAPLAIGRVELADGSSVCGLLCAHRPDDAVDVTRHGSWPRYLEAVIQGG
jgi:allophanate hydrolase